MSNEIDYIREFPDLAAIGRQQLQAYCDEWAGRPIARAFGVAQVFVDDGLLLCIHIDSSAPVRVGDTVVIHVDELLGYIVDRHFADAEQRRDLHTRIREFRLRGNGGRPLFNVIHGRRGTLYLTCKNPMCKVEMETPHIGIEGQKVECPPTNLKCPACGVIHEYFGHDLHLLTAG